MSSAEDADGHDAGDGVEDIEARRAEAAARVNLARVGSVVSVVAGAAVIVFGSALPRSVRNAALLAALLGFVVAGALGTIAVAELVRTSREMDDGD